MKLLSNFFGIGSIKNYLFIVIAAGLLFVGYHYPNQIEKVKTQKIEIKQKDEQIKKAKADLFFLTERINTDSVMYLKNVEIFQTNIIDLQNRNKTTIANWDKTKKELTDCESGLDCFEKNVFGKKRKVKCE